MRVLGGVGAARRRTRPGPDPGSLLLFAVVLALAGCAGDGSGSGATTQFDILQRDVFNTSCISGACHNSQTLAGGLNLAPGLSWAQLVGVEPDNLVARQQGYLRVVPFQPGGSFLVRKLGNPGLGEGERMPLGAGPLSPAQIQQVVAWIEAGAPPGAGPTATVTPTVAPSATATPTEVPASTATPSATTVPTTTPTATAVPPTVTGTVPPSATPTETGTPTATPMPSDTPTPSATPTVTATLTVAPGSTLAELQAEIFTPRCAVPACHTDASAAFNGDLSLEADSTYGELVGVEPQNFFARRDGLLRVDPGQPGNSFLVRKVTAPGLGEGARMPLTGEPLSADEVERIRAWIERGALPDD